MSATTITETTQAYLTELLEEQSTPGIGIHIFITQPGTQYAETCITCCKPGEEGIEDTAIALKDLTAWIDMVSEPFLEDVVMGYVTNRMGDQLTIKASNAKVPVVNRDNPVTKRTDCYLQAEISPGLANHGKQVGLIDVAKDNIAVLHFDGGCQGCGMIDITPRDGVEKTLIERIPELKGVRDVIDHSDKENVYY